MPSNGHFITFEGIDGAGKSSHIQSLVSALTQAGQQVVSTREPGGTPLAETLRECVLHTRMDALTEALLMFAARRDHLVQVIEPALTRGATVVCDRFTDATFAYQGHGRGFDLNVLHTLEQWVQQDGVSGVVRQPDLTLWFDVPPSVAADRLAQARSPDKFEALPTAFFERVAHGYRTRAAEAPGRFVRIDASQPLPDVWQQVAAACRARALLLSASAT